MDENWFENINWSGACLLCKAKHDGQCPNHDCAKINYDKNGNRIPLWVYHMDGDTLDEYLKSLEEEK